MELDAKIIFQYLMKECTEEEYSAINSWLEKDAGNKEWLFDMEALWSETNINGYTQPEYLQTQFEKTMAKVNRQKETTIRRKLIPNIYKYAAVVAACVIIGSTFYFLHGTISPLGKKQQNYMVENAAEQNLIKEVVLPDQTRVWLNSGSTLTYSSGFNQSERRVILTGEAYFQVKHDKTKPFRVETGLYTVKVLGTSFNVLSELNTAETTLIEGSVVIEDEHQREVLVLSPGQRVESSKETGRLKVENVSTDLETAWMHGFIAFENATITEIAGKLEGIYHQKIEINTSKADSNTYTGAVLKEKNVEQVLRSLQNTIPLDYKKDGKNITISINK